jgi:hypothetical protein
MSFSKQKRLIVLVSASLVAAVGPSLAADFSDFPYQPYDVAICQGYVAVHRDRFSPNEEAKKAYDLAEKILFRANEEVVGREAAIQLGRVSYNILRQMMEFESEVQKFEAMELPMSTRLLVPEVQNYTDACFDAVDKALKILGGSE